MSGERRIEADRRLGAVGLGFAAGGFLVGLTASVLIASVVAAVTGIDVTEPTFAVAVASSVGLWVGFLGVPLLVARRHGGAIAYLGLRVRLLVDLPLGLVVGAASVVATSLVTAAVLRPRETQELEEKAKDVIDRAQQPVSVTLLVIVLCIVTPIVEEVFFRGLVFRSLARLVPVPVAVAVAGLLFGLVHFSGGSGLVVLVQLGLLAGFGAVLCLLVWRTGRLGPAIVAHAAFNLTTVVSVLWQR